MAIKKLKVLTTGSVVSQLRDNTEYTFLQDEKGNTYIPLVQYKDAAADDDEEPEEKPRKSKKPADDDDEPEETAPKGKGKPAAAGKGKKKEPSEIENIVTDLDGGELTEAKAVAKLVTETGAEKKAVAKVISEFLNAEEGEMEIADVVAALEKLSDGGGDDDDDEEEEEEKPKKGAKPAAADKSKPAAGGKKKSQAVEPEDLEVGDRVNVYFGTDPDTEEEYDEWYEGEVVKVRGGKVSVKYDVDGETTVLDPEFHTEIHKL